MSKPTLMQKQTVANLIIEVAQPVTAAEASRVIRDLRREKATFPHLIAKVVEADRAGDHDRFGRLLRELKRRVRHGNWLRTLQQLGINPRRAQRLMAR